MDAKRILTILFLGIFLISFSSAFGETADFDETDGDYGSYSIESGWGFLPKFLGGGELAWVKLTENSDHCLVNCYAKGEGYFNEPKNFLDGLEFKNKLGQEETSLKEVKIYVGQLEEVTKQKPIYEEVCEEVQGNTTNQSYTNCYNRLTGYEDYTEEKMIVKEYEGQDIVGDFIWEIRAKKLPSISIDWIVTIWGEELDEWAWWNTDWNKKRLINLTADVGNFSYIERINFSADMNSDFSDVRFIDSTETVELNFTIENKVDSDFIRIRIYSQGDNIFYMYYGNFAATTSTESSSDTHFNPLSYYYLDEASGTNAIDSINNQNGTLTGGAVGQLGIINNSYLLTNNRITLTGLTSTSGTYTFNFWINSTQTIDSTTKSLFDSETPRLLIAWSRSGGNNVAIYDGTDWRDFGVTAPNDGQLHMMTYVLNSSSGKVDLYKDGVHFGSQADYSTQNIGGNVVLGADATNDNGNIIAGFDEVSIYEKALSVKQIQDLFTYTEPTYIVGAEEVLGATVNLISPEDNSQTNQTFQTFKCNSSFDTDIANLTLIIDGVANFTNSTVGTFIDLTHSENLTQGNYKWSCSATTVGEQTTPSPNRTLIVHTTPLSVIIHNPESIIDYHLLGNDLLLNWTVTEGSENLTEHVTNCTYEYNGTITILNNTVCTQVNQTNFTYILGINNLTFNVTDEFDLVNSSFVEWDITLLEINQTFDNQTFEGSQEIFVARIEVSEASTLSQAIFNYNDTNYTTSIIFSDGVFLITSSITIPSVDVTTNFSFTFFPIIDGQIFSLQTLEQEVLNVNLTQCGIGDNLLLNMSLFDEETKVSILGDMEINAQATSKTSGEISAEVNLSSDNITSVAICLTPAEAFENLYLDTEIRYVSTDRVSEFYHIQMADMGEYPKNLSLFDLSQNDSTEFSVTYKNNNFIFTEGAIIQLQRKYIGDDIYEIVEAPITGDGGGSILHIDLNTNKYRASVVKDGELLDFFDNIVFNCDNEISGDCTHSLDGTVNPNNDIPIETITDFTYSISIDEDNQTVTVLFAVPSGTPSTINVLLKQIDMFGNSSSCNTTIITSAGSITCDYTDTIEKSILELTISKNDVQLAVKSYVNDPDLDMDGMNFFIAFLFMISLVGMAIASPEWMILISVMVLIISGTLLLLQGMSLVMGLGAIAWVVIAAAIIILKMAKQEDR